MMTSSVALSPEDQQHLLCEFRTRLKSCLLSRGMSVLTCEGLERDFAQFLSYLIDCNRPICELCWEDLDRYREYLSTSYLSRGRPLVFHKNKALNVGRCLNMLREEGDLPQLGPRQGYAPSVTHYVTPLVNHGYRLLLSSFREYLETIGMSSSCVCAYPRHVRRFLAWLEGSGIHDIRNVDERTLLAYRGGPGKETRVGPASASTRINIELCLKKFFTFLYRTRRIHVDPAAHMEYTPSPRRLPRAMLEVAEVEAVLSAIDTSSLCGVRDLAIFELLYGTGLRSSELRGLTLSDIQLDSRVMLVHGKGGKDALVPFGEKAARALGLYLSTARPGLVRRSAGKGGEVVFLSTQGQPLTPSSLASLVHRCTEAAGIERKIVPHSLRHSCATHMLRNGCDLRVVQQLLRHESINTTLIYTRMLTSDIREAQRKYHPREQD